MASQAAAEDSKFELFTDEQTALAPPPGKAQYMRLRFDQALRGLKVDAPVEFQGLEIGKVVSVNLDFDEKSRSFPIIVGIVIYPKSLGEAHVKMLRALNHDPADENASVRLMGSFIENGLRAQARTGNLLTGQLYISLDFYPDARKVAFDPAQRPVQIPTVPSSLEQLQEQLQSVVDKLAKLPLDRIANNLDGGLSELRIGLKQLNSQTIPGVQGVLQEMRGTLKSASATLADDSPQREQLTEAIDELGRMSRSLRDLSDYLGRHPESLIRGRPKSEPGTQP
jgi:paraquat-inducible protein B